MDFARSPLDNWRRIDVPPSRLKERFGGCWRGMAIDPKVAELFKSGFKDGTSQGMKICIRCAIW